MLTVVAMNVQVADSSIYEDESIIVSVLVDFGDGIVYWADVELTNNTAFNATENACSYLGLELGFSWSAYGVWVYQIGNKTPTYPEYWHFLLWNNTMQDWEYASEGCGNYILHDGGIIGWSCVSDKPEWDYNPATWPGPKPLATPSNKYPAIGFRSNLYNTGFSNSEAPASNDVDWVFDTGSYKVDATPAVAYGKLFIPSWTGFYCLDENDGSLIWNISWVKGESSPMIWDNKIFVGSTDGKLYCLNSSDGEDIWSILLQTNPQYTGISSSPKISNGKVFVGTFNETGGNGSFYCLNAEDGTVVWKYSNCSSIHFSSAAIHDGKVFIGMMGLFNSNSLSGDPPYGILCLNENNGSLIWQYSTNGSVSSSPAIFGNNLYFTTKDGYLYKISENGEKIWEKEIGISVSSPAIINGKIYVGSGTFDGSGKFYCYDEDGNKLWSFIPNGGVQSSPVVADGKVFFATNTANGTIYSLDLEGNLVWNFMPTPKGYILGSPTVADNRLFIASDNGYIYCFAGNKNPVATFTYTPASPGLNDEITFDASSSSDTSGNIINYTWDFGDEETAFGKVVTHKYGSAGEYTITLTVTDDDGSTDTSQQIVIMEELKKAEKKPWYLIPGFEIITLLAGISVALLLTIIQKKRMR